jgi:hypothetical protein
MVMMCRSEVQCIQGPAAPRHAEAMWKKKGKEWLLCGYVLTYFGRARRTILCASVKLEAVPSATMAAHSITLDRPCPVQCTYVHQERILQRFVHLSIHMCSSGLLQQLQPAVHPLAHCCILTVCAMHIHWSACPLLLQCPLHARLYLRH